jgi:colanic acid/amylovoran biosynthesis protein
MIKILVLNVGKSNKGNCALVSSTVRTISNYIPNVQFQFIGPDTIHSNEFNIERWPGIISIRKPYETIISFLYLLECIYINFSYKLNINVSPSKKWKLINFYNSDIIINSGGDTISGEGGISTLTPLLNILYATLLHKPVVLYGESLGYFKNKPINIIAKFVLNKTSLIILRENLSRKYLLDNNIINPKIYVTSDPAFLLDPAPQSVVSEIFKKEGIRESEENRPLIGINPSGLISRFLENTEQTGQQKIENTMSKVVDNLIENLDANILMVPHVYTSGSDDRLSIKNILKDVKHKSNVYIVENEYTAQELKGIIGRCDLFIGMRMHSTIASTSMLVPTVGIAYSHKMHGIIGNMLGQNKYIVDINNFGYDQLISTIYECWDNRDIIKKELEIKIPQVKEKALFNGELVKELLSNCHKIN